MRIQVHGGEIRCLRPAIFLLATGFLPAQVQHTCDVTGVQWRTSGFPKMTAGSTKDTDGWRARWQGEDADHTWKIYHRVVAHPKGWQADPERVLNGIADAARIANPRGAIPVFASRTTLSGKFGALPFAVVGMTPPVKNGGMRFVLTAIGASHGYAIDVQIYGADPNRHKKTVLEFFKKGIRYTGPTLNPKWTKEEARTRWDNARPKKLDGTKYFVQRTPHYIVLGNTKSVRAFGKTLEDCHKRLTKTYPIAKTKHRRLLPVFLFASAQDFVYYMAEATGKAQNGAARNWFADDFYATWTEDLSVGHHLRGVAFHFLRNRLHLEHGPSWFTEAVMNYPVYSKSALQGEARKARQTGLELRDFMGRHSIWVPDHAKAYANYRVAGSLLGCVATTRWGRGKVTPFLRTMAALGPGDLAGVEAGMQRVFGFGLAEFELRWRKW